MKDKLIDIVIKKIDKCTDFSDLCAYGICHFGVTFKKGDYDAFVAVSRIHERRTYVIMLSVNKKKVEEVDINKEESIKLMEIFFNKYHKLKETLVNEVV